MITTKPLYITTYVGQNKLNFYTGKSEKIQIKRFLFINCFLSYWFYSIGLLKWIRSWDTFSLLYGARGRDDS